jgi:parallel beta-helix repeat protein
LRVIRTFILRLLVNSAEKEEKMNTQKTSKLRRVAWPLAGALAGLALLALVFLIMGVGAPSAACAEGPIVRYVAPTGTDKDDCTNPASPCRTIQYAIDQAGPGDEIRIAAGIYTDLHTRPVPAGYPRPPASGVITQVAYVSRTVTLRGGYTTTNWTTPNPAANPTTLDAGGGGRGLVVAGTISPTVEGLRFTGGNAAGLGGAGGASWGASLDAGGGIYVTSATLTLSGCQLYGNTASYGGGLHLRMSENTILSGNHIVNNTASWDGGGLHLHASTNVTITGNTIISNTAAGDGGLMVLQSRTVTLIGNHIVNNTASWDGGGLGVLQSYMVTLIGNTISGNVASGYSGGLDVTQSYTVTLIGNTISGNVTSGDGGGLEMTQSYTITLTDNTISGNTARDGGGLEAVQGGPVSLIGNTISGNTAAGDGGGLEVSLSSPVSLIGNTISGNTAAGDGGGLEVSLSSPVSLISNTISGNTAADDGGGMCLGHYATLSGNLISGNTVINGRGGGIYIYGDYTTLNGNTIIGNLARQWGGGLALFGDRIALTGNTIVSNAASYGGGLWVHESQGTALDNNVIADNSCSVMGAGLYMDLRSRLRLRHNSIVHNTGGDGSGVCLAEGTVVMTNTILVGHTTGITVAAGSTARLEATLWGSDAWANGADWGGNGTIFTGTVNLWGAPRFVNPAAGDYHLNAGSAAIDAGVNAGVTTDIDGEPRPIGVGYDIGADEYTNEYLRLYLPLVLR